ncbi:MAG TPA: sugar transferase [Dissulfurispiraceae bacterium]|nr:sugar transferase [Dissulfurispiraceae bacterium]
MKRLFDVTCALFLSLFLAVPMLLIAAAIRLTSPGPALHWSKRIGMNNSIFLMPKFRTMRSDAPAVATHLLLNPENFVTPIGRFLRKTSLDELPQLYSILKGTMTFVGPRPALFNQDDLVVLRTEQGIHRLVPGLTGWAQINGRDELPIPVKVSYDKYYLENRSFLFDFKILFLTFLKVMKKEGVSH